MGWFKIRQVICQNPSTDSFEDSEGFINPSIWIYQNQPTDSLEDSEGFINSSIGIYQNQPLKLFVQMGWLTLLKPMAQNQPGDS